MQLTAYLASAVLAYCALVGAAPIADKNPLAELQHAGERAARQGANAARGAVHQGERAFKNLPKPHHLAVRDTENNPPGNFYSPPAPPRDFYPKPPSSNDQQREAERQREHQRQQQQQQHQQQAERERERSRQQEQHQREQRAREQREREQREREQRERQHRNGH